MTINKLYSTNFYQSRNFNTKESAQKILTYLFTFFQPKSVIDFGCGVGTWLKTAQELGVTEILGLEGNWLDINQLVISEKDFLYQNLTKTINLTKRFDLAISLEVAEHIEERFSDEFVISLTRASDIILFSAAIPGQRGSGHVNEQWPEYWIKKFKTNEYIPLDLIRPFVWAEPKIKTWYKQNTILFIHKDKISKNPSLIKFLDERKTMWSIVHPDTFLRQVELSHPKYSNLSNLIGSLPIVTRNSIKTLAKKIFRR